MKKLHRKFWLYENGEIIACGLLYREDNGQVLWSKYDGGWTTIPFSTIEALSQWFPMANALQREV